MLPYLYIFKKDAASVYVFERERMLPCLCIFKRQAASVSLCVCV